MEACATAHHWARTLTAFGHGVRLIAPKFVKPYLKSRKNDMADAEAIEEAASHRIRERYGRYLGDDLSVERDQSMTQPGLFD